MLNLTWIKNPDHVSYCKENEVLPAGAELASLTWHSGVDT